MKKNKKETIKNKKPCWFAKLNPFWQLNFKNDSFDKHEFEEEGDLEQCKSNKTRRCFIKESIFGTVPREQSLSVSKAKIKKIKKKKT